MPKFFFMIVSACAPDTGTPITLTGNDPVGAIVARSITARTISAAGAPSAGLSQGAPATLPAAGAGATSGPPIIAFNGDNPATITVGATYADLGAQITGPTADENLGITTLVDGATTTQITLDTTKPGTHTILYTVTDPKGLTGAATRTVIVSALKAANDNAPAATSSPAVSTTTAATNDNPLPLAPTGTTTASITTASSTAHQRARALL